MKILTGRNLSAAGLIIPLLLASCTLWNARKWQELPDRGFTFAQFRYTNLNAGRQKALSAMREFPLEPVLESLRKKYTITIDAAEFEAFLSRGDLARIREEGMLMTNSYAWDSASKGANRAEIEIKVNYGDDMRVMNYSYQVVLKVGGSVRAIYFDNVSEADKLPAKILAHIGAGVTMAGYAPVKFNEAQASDGKAVQIQGRRWETEGRIKDQVDGYMKMLTPDNKKKFRDDMLRHLDDAAK
jgi:hypothetical protein